ncbi:MAG: hypothetical protein ACRDID_04640 [Ktedonobacterales bacterium]
MLLASTLYSALITPLAQALAIPVSAAPDHLRRMPGAPSHLPYSALAFEPDAIIEALRDGPPASGVYDLWTTADMPVGTLQVDVRLYAPWKAPLLGAAAQRALVAVGCDIHACLCNICR